MKTALVFFALTTTLFAACNNSGNNRQPPAATAPEPGTGWQYCYAYTSGKDTAVLQLRRVAGTVSGNLMYRFYEKDRNSGTIAGTIHGDTLLADYTYLSEGVQSVRKIAFLKTGSQLTEGISLAGESGVLDRTHEYDFSGIVWQPSHDCSLFFPNK